MRPFQCAALSPGMMRFACTAEATSPWNLADSDQRTYLVETVHSAIVLEALTRFLVDDVAALQEIADLMQSTQLRAMYEFAGETYSTNKAAASFALAKYRSTAGALKHLAESLATNTPSSSFTSRLQVNLLEAAHVMLLAETGPTLVWLSPSLRLQRSHLYSKTIPWTGDWERTGLNPT
jgi:hypothetical protein